MFSSIDYFSANYDEARERFRTAASRLDAILQSYPLQTDADLTIDVAIVRNPRTRAASESPRKMLVVSSGVHGAEAPPGCAIQLALLDALEREKVAAGVDLLLIHVINPYGFVHRRRWNEDNVDLNRNFLDKESEFRGTSQGYEALQPILNPASAPHRLEPYRLKAAWYLMRYGRQVIKQAVATGQYDYPQGLFFGGHRPSKSTEILRHHYRDWIGEAQETVHLDLHTGLGQHGHYRLLLEYPLESEPARWFDQLFGQPPVEAQQSNQTSYEARGTFGRWTQRELAGRPHRFATVEFGTHSLARVLGALRAENRAFHYAEDERTRQWTSTELQECFCPASPAWREQVLRRGVDVAQRCAEALAKSQT